MALTHEYQMTHITEHCEKYLLQRPPSIGRLVLADKYSMNQIQKMCLEYTMTKSLQELEKDEMYDLVEPTTKVIILTNEVRKHQNPGSQTAALSG